MSDFTFTIRDAMPHPLPSPCIGQCRLNEEQVCTGCRRTLDEIAVWSHAEEAKKRAIWQRLLALPQTPKDKPCQRCGTVFSCGGGGRSGSCWCADRPARLSMNPETGDCLCPACLAEALNGLDVV